ncbi:MAG: flagellar assembly protein FliH [Psychromonas sp.]|nr:flagellar assembly protein FliH [Psychromonas sp.]
MMDNENQFDNWIIPELDESETAEVEDTTLFGKPASWYHSEQSIEQDEVVDAEDTPQPLTLDDIEKIRQSAYEDGFQEGKEAGFKKGLEEGTQKGLQEGLQQGTAQGLQEGLASGQAQIDQQVTIWLSLIERLHNPLEKLDDNVEYQLIRLATELAEQIVRSEVQTNPQIILQALKQAVEALPVSEQKLRILLHPDDLKFVQGAYSKEDCLKRGWDLQAEPVLARGDCQVHTQASSIDYAFSSRIEQVLKHFFKENHQRLPEKNSDSNLLNEQPFDKPDIATESVAVEPAEQQVKSEAASVAQDAGNTGSEK